MRGNNVKIDFYREFCERVYGIKLFPDTDHWNMMYGKTTPAATKIIFTNGSEDPWKHAGVLKSDNPHLTPIEIVCDDCAHCVDLHGDLPTDSQALTDARQQITFLMWGWIDNEIELEKTYPTKVTLRELLG
jgi:hypothetical protein